MPGSRRAAVLVVATLLAATLVPVLARPAAAFTASPLHVTWMAGYRAPGTPARYDRVGVIEVGKASARNVLVLEPGTSAAAAYFVPLAEWIVARQPSWQVWAVQRRETLLDDESELDAFKEKKATPAELFDYYLGWLSNKSITHHVQFVASQSVTFAKQWGMKVAVEDLRRVITAAHRLGGKVVLGGHSLGGAVVTAYATWDFGGHPGADGLAGLVFIDGSSFGQPVSAGQARSELATLDAPTSSPWLTFGGITAPLAGIFSATGSAAALLDPNAPSLGQSSKLLPPDLVPPVPVTNQAEYGYALNVATSPPSLEAAQGHLGTGILSLTVDGHHTWDGSGALTPISRFATMFSGYPMLGVDGSEWYFPQRLTDDTGAVDNGNPNPAQSVLGVDDTMGHHLPKRLLIYAFAAHLGGPAVLTATRQLAAQSGIPSRNLTLVDRHTTYAHNDPAGAYPTNAFFAHLVPFLTKVARAGERGTGT